MDLGTKLRWYSLAVAVTVGGLCVELGRRRRRLRQIDTNMAASVEADYAAEPVSQLLSTMEQLKIAERQTTDNGLSPDSPASEPEEADNFIHDRDSANHSPSDFLSGNLHSDSHSESSNDSGKGGSDCANTNLGSRFDVNTPPLSPTSRSHLHHLEHGDSVAMAVALVPLPERLFVYEFEIPQVYVGLLIGKFGAFVNFIKAQTGASLLIKDHNRRCKLCAIEGTKSEIDAALVLIREKFPIKKYPQVTLAQMNVAVEPSIQPVLPDSIQLVLPPDVSCDVMISAVVAPNHVFVQQVTHPTYSSLSRLDVCMAQCYNEFVTPGLPRPIQPSMVCAAPSLTDSGWYRAKIVAVHPPASAAGEGVSGVSTEEVSSNKATAPTTLDGPHVPADVDEDCEVDICFVDYGGYSRVPASCLRQIRADFMSLPFQAIECFLANVAPMNGEEGWSNEAYDELENMTRDRMLQAQAIAYSQEGLPLIYLYQVDSNADEALINRQLVNRAVAQWVDPQQVSQP